MRRPEAGLIALAVLLSACTVPTEMPNWDVQWNLPVDVNELSIDVTDLQLPAGITIDSSGSPATRTGFSIDATVPSITRTLGVQCPTCPNATAPKPQFSAPEATTTVNLTSGSDLQSATLVTGSQIQLQLVNNFGFDPLNPPGGLPGKITLAVNNGGVTLGTLTLEGPAYAIPANSSRTFTVNLSGTINSSSPITVLMDMDSPAGAADQPVTMNPNQTFIVNPDATLKVAAATVLIGATAIDPSTSEMDLTDLGDMALRVEDGPTDQGAFLLTVTNPFSISANATLTFSGTKTDEYGFTRPMTTITKNIVLPAGGTTGTTTVTVPFTGTELREILGSSMDVTFGGTTVAGTTVVTPAAKITTAARMRIRLFMKEIEQ